MMVEAPQSFVVREECQKAASQNAFRRILAEKAGWSAFASTTAKGLIYLAATGPSGPWCLALDHLGVIQEMSLPASEILGPGHARFAFDNLGTLYAVLHRVCRHRPSCSPRRATRGVRSVQCARADTRVNAHADEADGCRPPRTPRRLLTGWRMSRSKPTARRWGAGHSGGDR